MELKLTNENYVSEAEKVIKEIRDNAKKGGMVTTSKIRKILAMVSDIYNDARHISGDKLDTEMISRIQYLKMHVVYEAGRDKEIRQGRNYMDGPVKSFIIKADIINQIDQIGTSKSNLITFCHYMEALVAYRKFLGERDE